MRMPRYLLFLLADEAAAVEARATRQYATAASVPHMDKSDRRNLLHKLDRQADGPPPPAPEIPKIAHDPAAAAAYFAARGIRVQTS
jgi:hypothetical protein